MGRYKKILVAYDGSVSSRNAFKQAIRLAESEKSWMKVVAVVPSYEGELDITAVRNLREVLRGPGEKLLKEAAEIAKAEGAVVVTNLEQGEPYERIIDVAESENCDLIVMGRRGLRRLERAFMGSVTARVIGHSRKDVLVVPRDTGIGFGRLLLATDGSIYSNAATKRAIDLAKSYGSALMAVSVVDVPPEFYAEAPNAFEDMVLKMKGNVSDVKKKAEESGLQASTFVGEGDAYKVITDLAVKEKAEMLIMGSHGRTGLKRLLMGSVTEKVIGHTPCPVLVVKGDPRA